MLWGLAALTMILGNFAAIAQKNIKRLLAYSSIAHAGYILMALVPYGQQNVSADVVASALFYLVAYAFTNFAAWAVVIALEKAEEAGWSWTIMPDWDANIRRWRRLWLWRCCHSPAFRLRWVLSENSICSAPC